MYLKGCNGFYGRLDGLQGCFQWIPGIMRCTKGSSWDHFQGFLGLLNIGVAKKV